MMAATMTLGMGMSAMAAEEGPITIGLLSTGTAIATYTDTTTKGAELAVAQINEAGGLLGREVVLQVEDGSNVADETINGANKLLTSGVAAVVGYPLSTGCLAIESLFKDAQVPLVVSGTSVRLKDETDNEFLFRGRASDAIQATVAIAFLLDDLGLEGPVGMLYENNDFGQGALTVVQEYCDEKGVELVSEGFNATDTDITSQVLKLKEAGVTSVVTWIAASSCPIVASGLYNQGVDVPKVGPVAVTLEENLTNCEPEWIDGWYGVTDICMTKDDEKLNTFVEQYKEMFGEDAYLTNEGANIYSQVMFVADGIERAGTTEGAALAQAMRETPGFEGLNGTYKLMGEKVDFISGCDISQDQIINDEIQNVFISSVSVGE